MLPAVVHIAKKNEQGLGLQWGETGPIALVLAPVRELAVQIHTETESFIGGAWKRIIRK